jgi:hypothetical protein
MILSKATVCTDVILKFSVRIETAAWDGNERLRIIR